MRAYHHFSVNRSLKHLLIAFGVLLVPLFLLIAFSLVSHISFFLIFSQIIVSAWRLLRAFLISIIIAWVIVVLIVNKKFEGASLAVLDVMQSLPTFAILPIGVHYFGYSNTTIILFLIITIIWPVVFSIVSSLKQANQSWHEAVIMTRIKGWNYLQYYLLPVTYPGIITGAIIGLGEGWEALIGTEILLNTPKGLGAFFNRFADNSAMTLFGVLVFLSIIFAINKLVWLPLLDRSHRLIEE